MLNFWMNYSIILNSEIESFELLLEYIPDVDENFWLEFVEKTKKISTLIIYSSPENINQNILDCNLYFTKLNISSESHCGCVSMELFNINIQSFTESLSFNSCLNRKISVDAEGNIKNCPSMSESFGNIKDTTLAEALEKPDFKKYWNINKDKIHICKDCEFRHVCTDCRAYVEDPKDILSKPLKCGYNPYIGEWSEWSTNPLKKKVIEFYGFDKIIH